MAVGETDFILGYNIRALARSRSGVIWGPIWIVLGDRSFPEVNWDDMVVALLAEFARAIDKLKVGSVETVRFFDGPFSAKFRCVTSGVVEVSLDDTRGRSNLTGKVSLEGMRVAVQTAVNDIYHSCLEFGWAEDSDVKRLESHLKEP